MKGSFYIKLNDFQSFINSRSSNKSNLYIVIRYKGNLTRWAYN